jgi:hypothetical protein
VSDQDTRSAAHTAPLATRLRAEAAEWDESESIPGLLIEAAEAIAWLVARVAEDEYALRRLR